MPTRLETLKSRLQQYIDAEAAVLSGAQEYAIGTRRLTRADLKKIAEMIRYLEIEVGRETAVASGKGRNCTMGVIPRDF